MVSMIIQDYSVFSEKPIRGIIHVGAHHGQEKEFYQKIGVNNIIWFEANDDNKEILQKNVGSDMIFFYALGQENKMVNFNIANNGVSSSILNLGLHKKYHPEVNFINNRMVEMKTLLNVVNENDIDITKYNFLNLDVQGFELEVIKGCGKLLNEFDYIYTEVNTNYIYEDCCLINEIDDYLKSYNFIRKETKINPFEWGEAFYIKK